MFGDLEAKINFGEIIEVKGEEYMIVSHLHGKWYLLAKANDDMPGQAYICKIPDEEKTNEPYSSIKLKGYDKTKLI